MAYIAETVGAQPIDFGDGAGSVMKGAAEAANLYAAQQKAEQVKLQLEDMRMKQDSMKAGVFLDYMDKISNTPNPAVKKILQKQYGAQHQKMYGAPMDQDTLKAITESPDFSENLKNIIDGMGIDGAGKEYAEMVNKLATALGLPTIDALKVMKQSFDYYIEEKKAKDAASAASGRGDRADRRLGLMEKKFERQQNLDINAKLKEAEEDKQVNEFGTQLVGANKGLIQLERAINKYRKSGGTETITYGQIFETATDIAALQAVKPAAVIPIGREKNVAIDISAYDKALASLLTNITKNPQSRVDISLIKQFSEQLNTVKTLLRQAYEKELDKGYRRGIVSGVLPQDLVEERKKEVLGGVDSELENTKMELGLIEKPKIRDLIQRGMSYEEILGKLPSDMKPLFTKEKYKSAVQSMKAQKGK